MCVESLYAPKFPAICICNTLPLFAICNRLNFIYIRPGKDIGNRGAHMCIHTGLHISVIHDFLSCLLFSRLHWNSPNPTRSSMLHHSHTIYLVSIRCTAKGTSALHDFERILCKDKRKYFTKVWFLFSTGMFV